MSQNNSLEGSYVSPKLLMQLNRNQKIPKLVSKYDPVVNKRSHYNQYQGKINQPANIVHLHRQISILKVELSQQRQEKQQIKQIIKQLTFKMQDLEKINEDLLQRLREMENFYNQSMQEKDKIRKEQSKKVKKQVYHDVQEYIKMMVDNITISLMKQRINPRVQQKLQAFLEELIQINPFSIENYRRKTKQSNNNPTDLEISNLKLNQNKNNNWSQNSKILTPSRVQYNTILSQLTKQQKNFRQSRMSQSFIDNNFASVSPNQRTDFSKDSDRFKTGQKRRRIFTSKEKNLFI